MDPACRMQVKPVFQAAHVKGAECCMAGNQSFNFEQPIRIQRLRANGLDIIIYTILFSVITAAVFLILCMKQGVFGIYFDFWRVLTSIPLIILDYFILQPLKELRIYTPMLAKKAEWTIDEMMQLTKKNREETEHIMTRVLESSFVVDPSCFRQV